MNRRSFLSFLGFAPLAIPAAIAAARVTSPRFVTTNLPRRFGASNYVPIIGRTGDVIFTPTRENVRMITIKAFTGGMDQAIADLNLIQSRKLSRDEALKVWSAA
jgi:hypothetical protein